jgi:hypothetical protein
MYSPNFKGGTHNSGSAFLFVVMKKLFFLIGVLLSTTLAAQTYYEDALLYSRNMLSGTARTTGAGGAFGSVGADIGSMSINPAGLGLFRSTDFSITPGLKLSYNKANFTNTPTTTSTSNLYFAQAGIAWYIPVRKSSKPEEFSFNPNKLQSLTLGINFQRQSFFSRSINYSALNKVESNVSGYSNYLNATQNPVDFYNYDPELILLKDAGLIYRDTTDGKYYSRVGVPVSQAGSIRNKGAKDEISLALGGNVSDKFYFGFGLGIPIVTNLQNTSFTESNQNPLDTVSHFTNYTIQSDLRTTGYGVNASFGIIYRAASWMRLGATYHMPTFFTLKEEYLVNSTVLFDTAYKGSGVQYSPLKYRLRSPMRGVASASFYIKQHAFISVDYEFQNYGAMRYNFGKEYQTFAEGENNYMKANYTFGHSIRIGAEGAIKSFRVRAGYGYSSSPFKKSYGDKTYRPTRNDITFGLGYKGKRFYADFAYVYSGTKDVSYMMALNDIKNTYATHRLLLTLGWKLDIKKK